MNDLNVFLYLAGSLLTLHCLIFLLITLTHVLLSCVMAKLKPPSNFRH